MKYTEVKEVFLKQTGAGHYTVELYRDYAPAGTFTTTDMQIVEDIREMNRYIGGTGFEEELTHFETFDEVLEYVEDRIDN